MDVNFRDREVREEFSTESGTVTGRMGYSHPWYVKAWRIYMGELCPTVFVGPWAVRRARRWMKGWSEAA